MNKPLSQKIKMSFFIKEIGKEFSIIDSKDNGEWIIKEYKMEDNRNELAKAIIHFLYLPEYTELAKLDIDDYISLSFSTNDGPFIKDFCGIIKELSIYKSDIGSIRIANLISPFVLLENKNIIIKGILFDDCIYLSKIIKRLIEISGIRCDLIIEKDAECLLKIDKSVELPASLFLKQLLLQNNLVGNFNADGTLHIFHRKTYDAKRFREDWSITDKDLESGEIYNLTYEEFK